MTLSRWGAWPHIWRSLHLEQGLAWGQMAVIVRQSSSVELIRQELRRGGVPLAPDTPALLLRSDQPRRPYLTAPAPP